MKISYSQINSILEKLGMKKEPDINNPGESYSHLVDFKKFKDSLKDFLNLYRDDINSKQFKFFQTHLKKAMEFSSTHRSDVIGSFSSGENNIYHFLNDMRDKEIEFDIKNIEVLRTFTNFINDITPSTHKKIENEFIKAFGVKKLNEFFKKNIEDEKYSPKVIIFPKIMMVCLVDVLENKNVSNENKESILERMVGASRKQLVPNPNLFSEPAIPFFMDFYKNLGEREEEIKRKALNLSIHKVLNSEAEKLRIDTIITKVFEKWGYFPNKENLVGESPEYMTSVFTWNVNISSDVCKGRGLNGVNNDKLKESIFRFLREGATNLGFSLNETSSNYNFSASFANFDKFVETVPKFKVILDDLEGIVLPFMVSNLKNKKISAEDLSKLSVDYYSAFQKKNDLNELIGKASGTTNIENTSGSISRDFKL